MLLTERLNHNKKIQAFIFAFILVLSFTALNVFAADEKIDIWQSFYLNWLKGLQGFVNSCAEIMKVLAQMNVSRTADDIVKTIGV